MLWVSSCTPNVRRQRRRCPEKKPLRNGYQLTEELRKNHCESVKKC